MSAHKSGDKICTIKCYVSETKFEEEKHPNEYHREAQALKHKPLHIKVMLVYIIKYCISNKKTKEILTRTTIQISNKT